MPPKAAFVATEESLTFRLLARDRALESLTDILTVSKAFETDPSKCKRLFTGIKRLDNLIPRFQVEQAGIINALVTLGCPDDFELIDSPIIDTMEAVDAIREIFDHCVKASAIKPLESFVLTRQLNFSKLKFTLML